MPELPDVEGFRRLLAQRSAGHRITRVDVRDAGVLRGIGAREFAAALSGRRFSQPGRHGKWLIAPFAGGPVLLLHFGMTGALSWHLPDEPAHRHDRIVFALRGGELRYRDMRKLQGARICPDADAVGKALAGLGPDALGVPAGEFGRLLAGHPRRQLKAALTDQGVIAGLGNLLADEICWRARLSPGRAAGGLDDADRRRLHRAMRTVLRDCVEAGRVPGRRGWLTGARDEDPACCPRCGTALCRRRVTGRTTVWCPRCQPAP